MTSWWFLLLTAAVVAIVVITVAWIMTTASRLDRLHIRYDKAWQALDAALGRRAVVARSIADALTRAPTDTDTSVRHADKLKRLSLRAERADRDDREDAENALSAALAQIRPASLSPQLAAELADAEARVLIARRFHNDAVRDIATLRRRRPVRWLRLAGTASEPLHFEIAERELSPQFEAAAPRSSARIVVLDQHDRVLLLRGRDPEGSGEFFWFTVGGGVEPGESLRETAVRELREETGYEVPASALRGPVWKRSDVFSFNGTVMRSEEEFFVARTGEFVPSMTGLTDLENRVVSDYKWCTPSEMETLALAGEKVYPEELPNLVSEAVAVLDGERQDLAPRRIH
ncbi:NUDIX hydrolase [Hoyosella altamirensis]|uniref:8-oxo-dGTP pyrophosphatase MutT (NUDIX family) n=1 Tax=Hoyosella altamirensis TaxID=616997 RepID=A0A839RTS9_9ACTN|nr:NUDIX domain-containing protein [Hoyosella altamirensis]MBB3039970.1 8-oxo-dGTP pyrophosphatase MutT (NUDIX family) [Hoyosella altamirensis]